MNEPKVQISSSQHQKALDIITAQLERYGFSNTTASAAEYGENAAIVGMAYEHWSKLDERAAYIDYEEPAYNMDANDAYEAYRIIEDMARLQPAVTEIAAEFDEARELEETDCSDMVMSYGREGY